MTNQISLVTLSYNNFDEVRKTVASVVLQSVPPHRYLIIDSSDEEVAESVRNLAEAVSCEYVWVQPKGVYPAMNHALGLLDDEDFVWFINSSDWLAGPKSIEIMRKAVGLGTLWAIGGLKREADQKMPFHPIPPAGDAFAKLLIRGGIGFAHPSAIMQVGVIRQVGRFDEAMKIAADYKLALGFLAVVGVPEITPEVVAVHVPTGLTSRNRVQHAWEKARARRSVYARTNLFDEFSVAVSGVLTFLGHIPQWRRECLLPSSEHLFEDELEKWEPT